MVYAIVEKNITDGGCVSRNLHELLTSPLQGAYRFHKQRLHRSSHGAIIVTRKVREITQPNLEDSNGGRL
jgi:hypothetical protein